MKRQVPHGKREKETARERDPSTNEEDRINEVIGL